MIKTISLNPALKSAWESRLARYALATGALLGVPATAGASVVYSGLTALSVDSGHTSVNINLNPGMDAIPDLTVTWATAGFSNSVSVTPAGTNGLNVGPLSLGSAITLGNTTSGATTLTAKNCCVTYSGPWSGLANGSSAYLGVRFDASGQDHLGWVQITVNNRDTSSLQVDGYAYNDVAGAPINAGDLGAVPEPTSLLLFASGAAGVLALRRRRKAA